MSDPSVKDAPAVLLQPSVASRGGIADIRDWQPATSVRTPDAASRTRAAWALAGVLALTAVTAVLGVRGPILDHPVAFVTARAVLSVGLALLTLLVLARGSPPRLAFLLIALAYALGLVGLAEVNSPLVFTIGRAAVPLSILVTMFFCLAYPDIRITTRSARRVFSAAAVTLLTLDAATVLLTEAPPVEGPFVRCVGADCPSNPFNAVSLGSGPSSTLQGAVGLAIAGTAASATVLVALRAKSATRLQRRSLAPLFGWTLLAAGGFGIYVAIRLVDANARLLTPAAIVVAAIIALLPLAIGLGMARGRLFAMNALERMISGLGERPSLMALQRTMRRAFADPQFELLKWHPSLDAYVSGNGELFDLQQLEPGRQITHFTSGDERIAAAVHDSILSQDTDVLEAAGRAVRLVLENWSLSSDLERSSSELRASRTRLARAADNERRRIERDLHDGVQHHLITLGVKLELLRERGVDDPAALASDVDDAAKRVDAALADIRQLARGIYPQVLTAFGLSAALEAPQREMPVDLELRTALTRRFASEVETAVYFCCVEGLQNIAKHCGTDARASLLLVEQRGWLEFTLVDSGPGFDPQKAGDTRGLTGMKDRLQAVGGDLRIESSPGNGTRLSGRVPAISA